MATESEILSTENVVLASVLFMVLINVLPSRAKLLVGFAMTFGFLTFLGVVYAPFYLGAGILLLASVLGVVRSYHAGLGYRLYNRGVDLQAKGRHSEALANYDRSLTLLPRRSDTSHNRGMVLADLGRHGAALQSYDKALEIRPTDPDTWNFRGLSLGELGRLHDAVASFDRSLALRPNHAWVIENRTIALDELRSQQ